MFTRSDTIAGKTGTAGFRTRPGAALALALAASLAIGGAGLSAPARAASPQEEVKAPAAQPILRPFVELDDKAIHLGDLFDNAGKYADRAIASAPEPGESVVLEAAWLWRVANAYGVEWRPASRYETATVRRASTRIPADTIAQLLHQAASRDISGDPELIDLEFDAALTDINLPPRNEATIRLERWSYDPGTGRFSANIAAPAKGTPLRLTSVSGRVFKLAMVPVPIRRIDQGEVIGQSDIEWQPMREQGLGRTALTGDTSSVVGMAARRALSPGSVLRASDVEAPILVERRTTVLVVLQTPQMTLTMQGRALDRGALGESVRVENLQSKRIVEGTVSGPGKVTIDLPHVLALR